MEAIENSLESLGNPNGILVTLLKYVNDWCACLSHSNNVTLDIARR